MYISCYVGTGSDYRFHREEPTQKWRPSIDRTDLQRKSNKVLEDIEQSRTEQNRGNSLNLLQRGLEPMETEILGKLCQTGRRLRTMLCWSWGLKVENCFGYGNRE